MKRKHVLYGVFITLIIVKLVLLKIDHEYGLSLITNYLTTIVTLIIVIIGLIVAKKENLYFFIHILIFLYLGLNLWNIYSSLISTQMVFYSPDEKSALIIEERSSLLHGSSWIYEQKYYIFKKELPCSPLSGYKIFYNENYKMSWVSEDEVMILYKSNDASKNVTIKFNQ
ncbi:hypothetical protein [Clostridium sp. UBA4548]|uniref:hypothetical protein n=1 Tax=Clostridium sp. UBA4548 TaxID=1946361 RepID=UPI0025B9D517|nr:hypothetical protein [Clostridium sp. UBA4548]